MSLHLQQAEISSLGSKSQFQALNTDVQLILVLERSQVKSMHVRATQYVMFYLKNRKAVLYHVFQLHAQAGSGLERQM